MKWQSESFRSNGLLRFLSRFLLNFLSGNCRVNELRPPLKLCFKFFFLQTGIDLFFYSREKIALSWNLGFVDEKSAWRCDWVVGGRVSTEVALLNQPSWVRISERHCLWMMSMIKINPNNLSSLMTTGFLTCPSRRFNETIKRSFVVEKLAMLEGPTGSWVLT